MPEYVPLRYRSPEEEAPADAILFKNAKIFNGKGDAYIEATEVLIEGNLITKVGSGLEAPTDKKTAVVDCAGKTLMPGLIDMHSHLCFQEGMLEGRDEYDQMSMGAMCAADCLDYLNQGFTTVRDAGGNVLGMAKAVRLGRIMGPRIYACGAFISQTGGHGDTGCCFDMPLQTDTLVQHGVTHICDSVAEVRRACRNNFRNGATQIKYMAGGGCASAFDPIHVTEGSFEEMKAACDVAADYGSYVMIHAYHDRSIMRALDAGVKCVEHGFLMSEECMKRMVKEGIAICIQAVMSLEVFADPELITFFSRDQKNKAAMVNSGAANMMKLCREYKPILISGGDMFGKGNQERQSANIIAMVTLGGFDSATALRSATGDAAEVLSWCGGMNPYKDGKLGVIEEGAYADVILVDGDPLADIEALKRDKVRVVIKDGKCYKYKLEDNALEVVYSN
ncbi:amidohydrolase [Seminavis robusta]|uniref:Amidohydrolase n=1 Tax=Seminavis robusta TaxID=568900 RepID=A0A9N8DZE9_9STRA|nr:amidohydrolase [Seminavis robusta]|eukprot:Sro389_g132570.1 amidohydrolase (450) ;mRNA; r:26126-27670